MHVFPVPTGIINPHGGNSIAIAVWSLDATTAGLGGVALTALNTYAGGPSVDNVPAPAYDPAVNRAPAVTAPTGTVPVSALPFLAASNGWGPVERNRSVGDPTRRRSPDRIARQRFRHRAGRQRQQRRVAVRRGEVHPVHRHGRHRRRDRADWAGATLSCAGR